MMPMAETKTSIFDGSWLRSNCAHCFTPSNSMVPVPSGRATVFLPLSRVSTTAGFVGSAGFGSFTRWASATFIV